MESEEVWAPVEEWNGDYEFSANGEMRNAKTKRLLFPCRFTKAGWRSYRLTRVGKKTPELHEADLLKKYFPND